MASRMHSHPKQAFASLSASLGAPVSMSLYSLKFYIKKFKTIICFLHVDFIENSDEQKQGNKTQQ